MTCLIYNLENTFSAESKKNGSSSQTSLSSPFKTNRSGTPHLQMGAFLCFQQIVFAFICKWPLAWESVLPQDISSSLTLDKNSPYSGFRLRICSNSVLSHKTHTHTHTPLVFFGLHLLAENQNVYLREPEKMLISVPLLCEKY